VPGTGANPYGMNPKGFKGSRCFIISAPLLTIFL
jgi:hypothetical protein